MISSTKLCGAALAMLVAGCASAHFEAEPGTPRKPCPPLVYYSAEAQAKALAELNAIPEPCALCDFMDDYLLMRDQCR